MTVTFQKTSNPGRRYVYRDGEWEGAVERYIYRSFDLHQTRHVYWQAVIAGRVFRAATLTQIKQQITAELEAV